MDNFEQATPSLAVPTKTGEEGSQQDPMPKGCLQTPSRLLPGTKKWRPASLSSGSVRCLLSPSNNKSSTVGHSVSVRAVLRLSNFGNETGPSAFPSSEKSAWPFQCGVF